MNRGTNIETLIGYTFDSLRREIAQRRRSAFSVDELVAEIEVQAPVLKMEAAEHAAPGAAAGQGPRPAALHRPAVRLDGHAPARRVRQHRLPGPAAGRPARHHRRGGARPAGPGPGEEDPVHGAVDRRVPPGRAERRQDGLHPGAARDRPDRAALPARAGPDHAEPGGRGPGGAQAAAHPLRAHHRAGPAGLAARDLRRRAAGDDPLPAEAAPRHLRPDRRGRDGPARGRGRHPRPGHPPRRRDPGRLRGPARAGLAGQEAA